MVQELSVNIQIIIFRIINKASSQVQEKLPMYLTKSQQNSNEQLIGLVQVAQSAAQTAQKESDSSAYMDFMGWSVPLKQTAQRLTYHPLLEEEDITFNEENQSSLFSLDIVEVSPNMEVIFFMAQYRRFTIPIYILNVATKSKSHYASEMSVGSFGTVFKTIIFDQVVAIKCFQFQENFPKILQAAIEEYVLLCIASALKAGPHLTRPLGFDLIVYEDCIQFAMEFCEKKGKNESNLERQLKQAMRRLHLFKIIHFDIKPENICFSPFYSRYVLIDYGLSKVILEGIESKTMSAFRGTLEFSSPQLKQAYFSNSKRLVNLYHNDMVSLQISLHKIQESAGNVMLSNEQSGQTEQFYQPSQKKLIDAAYFLQRAKFEIFRLKYFKNLTRMKKLTQSQSAIIDSAIMHELYIFAEGLSFDKFLQQFKEEYFQQNYSEEISKKTINPLKAKIQFKVEEFSSLFSELNESQTYKQKCKKVILFLKEHQKEDISQLISLQDLQIQQKFSGEEFETYMLRLSRFISIQNEEATVAQKIQACRIFLEYSHPELKDFLADGFQVMAKTYELVFDFSCNAPHTEEKVEILLSSILPIILAEVKSQQQLVWCFQKALQLQLPSHQKLSVLLKFLTSISWVDQKYITRYNYQELEWNMVRLAQTYLSQLPQMPQTYTFEYGLAREIIGSYFEIENSHNSLAQLVYYIKRCGIRSMNGSCLSKQLLMFVFNRLLKAILDEGYSFYWEYVHDYYKCIALQKGKSGKFSYYSFLLFRINSQSNDFTLLEENKALKSKLSQIFKHFPKYFHFKRYYEYGQSISEDILPNIQKIKKDVFSKIEASNVQSKLWWANYLIMILNINQRLFNTNGDKTILFEDLQRLMKLLNSTFILQLQQKSQLSLNHRHAFYKSIETLTQIITSSFLHMHQQTNNMIVFQFEKNANILSRAIHMESCFQCKFKSLIKILNIRAVFYHINQKWKETFDLYLEATTFFMKDKLTHHLAIKFSEAMMSLCRNQPFLLQKYNPFLFNYCLNRLLNNMQVFLQKLSLHNNFVEVYIYLFDKREIGELFSLIIELLIRLKESKQASSSRQFYEGVLQAVSHLATFCGEKRSLISNHSVIIINLAQFDNCYVGLYFSALFVWTTTKAECHRILLKICHCLNSLNVTSRQLILNTFYLKTKTLFNPKERRQKALLKKHYKYAAESLTAKKIAQFKRITKSYIDRKATVLTAKMNEYYRNNQNLPNRKQQRGILQN